MTDWTIPAALAGASALLGLGLLWGVGGHNTLPDPRAASREDLVKRRTILYDALRDLPAERARMSVDLYDEEHDRLEREAARVLRDLDQLDAVHLAPATERLPSFSERYPRLTGALLGGAVVAAIAAIATGLPALDTAPVAASSAATAGGTVAESIVQLEAAVAADDSNLEAKNRLSHLYILADRVMDAWALAEAVTKVAPQDSEARTHQAVVLMASGHMDVAAQVLDKVLAVEPGFVEALGYRGAVYREQGQPERAVELWNKLLTIDPAQASVVRPAIAALEAQIAAGGAGAPASSPAVVGEASVPPSGQDDAAGRIMGRVVLDEALASRVRATDTLFILARPEGVERGPPVAVERLPISSFPLAFDLGPEDSPMGGTLSGRVTLSARVDQDGNAMTRGEGELEARLTVEVGAKDVELRLGSVAP